MHAVPKAPEKKQLEKEGSRLETLKKQGREPTLPECSCQYLLDYLLEVGPVEPGGFGPSPLSHQELLAWQINMRRMLQPWEVTMLRRLSFEYAAMSGAAQDSTCPAPYSAELTERDRRSVAAGLMASLDQLSR